MTEGITVRGIGHQVLSKELYQEVVIISDMYDLNEYMALDLLCTAQIQLSYHPGLTRGLVAILLYYDGRKALVSTLRLLIQARTGVVWKLGIATQVSKYVSEYTDYLMNNGVFQKILELLKTLDLSKEIDLLQKNRALGSSKHHRQILDLFEDIRQQLADIIFMWSAQTGLPREPAINLINHLRTTKIEEEANGAIDHITLTLQMALLYALDLSVLHIREDGEEIVQSLPLLSESGLIEALMAELMHDKGKWESEGLHALTLFAMGICLATLRLLPQTQALQNAIEQEDFFVGTAIDMKVFNFLNNVYLESEVIFKERFYYYRIHNMLTDFIVLLQNKVKELRMRADEAARTLQAYAQEGLDAPPNLPRNFEQFMYCISKLYSQDKLKLELMLEYWCPAEITPSQAYSYRTPPRSVSLFKFVRLAGDMIPPSLFNPYLTMLSGLASHTQAARYCFNMLKQNGPGQSSTLSWDHFFGSIARYLNNLRQEAPAQSDTVYRHRNFARGITPQEIQGLHSVLLLIRTIAEYDDFSRIALCEHPAWAPLSVLLGLISCSVPIPLKSALLSTLAALSKSPETAAQMWNNLEASQILVTIPSTSSYQPRGIQTELDEIESRMEEYPMTRGLLELLNVLTDSGIPRTLGAGPRKPGFDPYLTFIINSVFLKFYTRAYKNLEEKWHVAKLCLKLIEKFLNQYDPNQSDFLTLIQTAEFNAPPGFHLMIQLNTKSQFLDLILLIIDEGCVSFDMFVDFPGKNHLEDCTLYCLNILNRGLSLQQKFFSLATSNSCTILLTGLNKLLLNINQRTSKPDYIMKICKYVSYQTMIPNHALIATKVLTYVTKQPPVHSQIMNVLLSYSHHELDVRQGFVLCLDADEDWKEKNVEDSGIVTATKEAVIKLLKQCMMHPAPNLAHYLFGFDVKRDISKTVFQFPGVLGFPRTCLHSLFSVMNSILHSNRHIIKPTLIEASYSMLYTLCANPKTVGPILKFVRQTQNFFQNHVQAIPTTEKLTTSEMNQLSWLLKTIAIEQKLSSQTNQIFYLKHLTQMMVGFPTVIEKNDDTEKTPSELLNFNRNSLLNKLIKNFDFNVEEVECPQWDYFDNNLMEKLIENCESGNNPRLIDVKKLHQVLIDELSTLQGTAAASQRQLIVPEIQKVLTYAIKVNSVRQYAAATIRFIDAWRQLTQVIFVTLPADVMSIEEQQILLIELLETLLNKMLSCEALPEVASLASGALLLLLVSLKKTHVNALKRKKVLPQETIDEIYSKNVIYTNTSSLKYILHGILEWILVSSVSSQKLRVNLYGSLLQFLHMISVGYEDKKIPNQGSFYVKRLDNKTTENLTDDRILISANVLAGFGDKLIEVLCHDCIGGHDICKMLAMSSFNLLIMLNLQANWVTFLSSKGYLKHLIDSVLNSDTDLKQILETVPDTLRPIYLYETKMSLIARIAITRMGAEMLLEQRILSCLASMRVYDDHPKIEKQTPNVIEDFIPSVESRYQQILFPALDLCDALLTSLGTDNRAVVAQIMNFLLSHLDIVESVLQQGCPALSTPFMKELAMITGIFFFNYSKMFVTF